VTSVVQLYPVKKVILFGSYARGDQYSNSDVDLIIDCELKGLAFFELVGRLIESIPVKSNIFELREIIQPSDLFDAIKQEGIVIYNAR
jgi:predicted nucleotidyltransferase